jgi:hypothetical protein
MAKKMTETKQRRSDFKGLKKVVVRIEPEQDAALAREALRRAQASGSVRPDKSEIVREALDAYPKLRHGR